MRFKPISRRRMLRGALGGASVALGLPLLDAMLNENGTALAQNGQLPSRLGIFFWGNGRGVRADRWTPADTGANWTPSMELAPLMGIKDYVSVATGMTARMPNSPRGHHDGSVAILSGYDFIPQDPGNAPYRSTFKRPSIDQLAAEVLATNTAYRSLELGISTRVIKGEGTTLQYMSHNGPDNVNPPEFDPQKVYERLFADAQPNQGNELAMTLRELRASVLDGVLTDLSSLRGQVGASDKARLDQHAEHIRTIERRLQSEPAAVQCDAVQNPGQFRDESGKEPLAERLQAMGELLAVALSCDMTRVFTVQFSGSVGYTVFWQVGLSSGHHDLSHQGAAAQEALEASTVFTMEQFGNFLNILKDTPDGTGNLLDRTIVLGTSDHSDGAAHSVDDFPVLVAGGGGLGLPYPGVHYHSGNREHTNKVLLTILRKVGVDIAELGEGNARQTDGLSALEG